MMQYTDLASFKYFSRSLLIYLLRCRFAYVLHYSAFPSAFGLPTARSHPRGAAQAICSPCARDESPPDPAKARHRLPSAKKKIHLFTETL